MLSPRKRNVSAVVCWSFTCTLWLALALIATRPAWPQASTGSVSGTIRDQSGASVPRAAVVLTNTATNETAKATANEVGFYLLPGVVPGAYRLTVEAPGLQRFEGTLTVQVQQSAAVDVALRVGQTTTEISVTDVTPLVTTDNPTLGQVLEHTRIDQLPINGRQFTTLLATVPGMERTRAFGLRDGSAEFVMDGAALTDTYWGFTGPNLQEQRLPGLDSIQEFKVETNSSSAKFTRPTSVVMSTKSGSNALHGSAFETNRTNGVGNARTRTDYYSKAPQLIRNEFGVSSGGPVFIPKLYNGKNRTFWFFGYEAFRITGPTTGGASVPTPAMRNGDFSGLVNSQGQRYTIYDPLSTDSKTWSRVPFTNNQIPVARQSPLAKQLFAVTPLPTQPTANPLEESNWWGPWPDWKRQWTTSARVDHSFSENDRFYGRYTQGMTTYYSQRWGMPMLNGVLPGIDNVVNSMSVWSPNKSIALSYVRTLSPTFFNEVLVSGMRMQWWKYHGEANTKYTDLLGLPNPLNVPDWPRLTGTGLNGYQFTVDDRQSSPSLYVIVDDNATKIYGKHELQFGFHYRYDRLNILPDTSTQGSADWGTAATALYDPRTSPTNPQATPFTGHNLANMYLGVMNYNDTFRRSYYYMRTREQALYLQDNYKVSSRLTLNLGLRWEHWPPYVEKNNSLTGFSKDQHAIVIGRDMDTLYKLGVTLPSIVNRMQALGVKFITAKDAGMPDQMVKSTWRDFGPRFGFAYRTSTSPRALIVRGGYRISHFRVPGRNWVARLQGSAPGSAYFQNSLTDPASSPDGIGNYGMRSVPTIIAGANSQNALTLEQAAGLNRGTPGAAYFSESLPNPRVQDWNLTFEKQIAADTVLRATYVGNHSSRLDQIYDYNNSTPDYIWYVTTGQPLPTGEYSGVARRPYDSVVYGSVGEYGMWGWGNHSGVQMEVERRYSKGYGFQLYYNVGNTIVATGQEDFWNSARTTGIPELNQFLPGAVPTDFNARNRFINYQRDVTVPKHRVGWNWLVDLPFGKGKLLGGNAGGLLDKVIGGWQVAGMGSLWSTYFALPTGIWPNGNKIETYGYDYPVQDCTSGTCYPGYLWFNGYIPANKINSVDPVTGKPNGVMGVPANYKPAAEPLIPWPKDPKSSDPMYAFYGTNTVWVPLKNGSSQRTTYAPGLHPWRNQYLPSSRQWNVDASLFKRIPIGERLNARFNADFFNVFNHPGNPSSVSSTGVLSTRLSAQPARVLQMTLRLVW